MNAEAVRRATFAAAMACALSPLVASCGDRPAEAAQAGPPATPFNAAEFSRLAIRVERIEAAQRAQQDAQSLDEAAYLRTSEQSYSQVRTAIGYVAVSVVGVADDPSGSKVVLNFGNPNGATLRDVAATIEYGAVDAAGRPAGRVFATQRKLDELPAASWRKFTVALPDMPPGQLGYLRVKGLNFQSIAMRQLP